MMFDEYKNDLPKYMENKMNELINELQNKEQKSGLSTAKINSLIRAKNMYGAKVKYSVEELSIMFDYYQKFIVAINEFEKYPPTKKNFCGFCGISTALYDSYLMSNDEERSELMKMIDDYITDVNLTSAQMKEIDSISTMFRAKAEHGMVEATAPVVIEHKSELNLGKIQQQIADLKRGKSIKTIELGKENYDVE